MKPYLERLQEGVLLFDGAMGTRLYDKGVFVNRSFDEVSLSNPSLIKEIHSEYVQSGAQAIETNTFGANRIKLKGFNLNDKVKDINLGAAKVAREVAGSEVYVAGAVGPTGEILAPLGPLSIEEASFCFREQMEALVDGGVDLILLETFKNIDELLLAAKISKNVAPHIPVQAQFSVGTPNLDHYDEYRKQAIDFAKQLELSKYVDVIGFNCSVGPGDSLEVLLSIRSYVTKPISVMPNAGYPKKIEDRYIYMATPDYFAEYANRFVDAGATIIGGCCGTGPEHIQKMGVAALSMDVGRRHIELKITAEDVQTKTPQPLNERSRLGHYLNEGKWIETVELTPPMGTDLSTYINKANELYTAGVDFINVPDGPRASSRISALVASLHLQQNTHIEPIFHMCTRDKNLIGLQSELLGCEALGLRNMLLITGDPPKVGRYPDVTGVFDIDSIGLTSLVERLNQGVDLGGQGLPQNTNFVKGAGINPTSATLDTEIERVYKKAEAGCDYFITQPIYDVEKMISFLDKIKETKVPVILGVWPLASYRNALFLHNEVPGVTIPQYILDRMKTHDDKEQAREDGIKISREIIKEMKPFINGVQISPPFGRIKTALDVLKVSK
ncbi:bifunctional homocysteine S-methyltransferase/methylenetetrahydrofolate reductase [Spirochaeta cellobiosiphila]|uniref:bifunctional homocysteine S-methyltransferase/methylenetetrahydrofolate reductase n=1 Tax=Spirochaeta cellobiosiphila TaxID=504483 RepID=UPI0003F95716|nr:bifunctional homocysteine S-methyltransferase/methylenetetrahydrofolate reductase [Spirochaeta cellobiosiphila]